jgi:hypothetical protein
MRRIIVFILSGAILAAGLYIIGGELLFSSAISIRVMSVGLALALLGGYLLWTDFVAPALKIRTWEDG